jgi:amino-acid N-acetyltransferase
MLSDLVELDPGELPTLADALRAAGLPCSDICAPGRRFYRLGESAAPLGFVGLEACGADGLLRSVVVAEGHRGAGVGRALVEAAAAQARNLGMDNLWLLTTAAADFFERVGFARRERSAAPPLIQGTAEFRELCPASAVCLVRSLASESACPSW